MPNEKLAVIMYEGYTEAIFYKKVFRYYLPNEIRRVCKNLKGGSGVDREVCNRLANMLADLEYRNTNFYVYAFIDREGPITTPSHFHADAIRTKLNDKRIVTIKSIEAIMMIESWFFYDLEGICTYAGLKCTKSLKARYSNPHNQGAKELGQLIMKGKKRVYVKGEEKFLNSLEISKIVDKCSDLHNGLEMICNDFSNERE